MWGKLKALSGRIIAWSAVLAAVFFVLQGRKVTRLEKRAEKKLQKGVSMANSEISSQIQKGKKLVESAQKDKDAIVEIKDRMYTNLEAIAKDDTADDIADRFNSKRKRL